MVRLLLRKESLVSASARVGASLFSSLSRSEGTGDTGSDLDLWCSCRSLRLRWSDLTGDNVDSSALTTRLNFVISWLRVCWLGDLSFKIWLWTPFMLDGVAVAGIICLPSSFCEMLMVTGKSL